MQKLLEDDKKSHKISRIAREDAIRIGSTNVFRCCSHRRRNHLARRIHQALGKPFEDLLDSLRIRLLQVCCGESDADIGNASGDFFIVLQMSAGGLEERRSEHTSVMNVSSSTGRARWF